MVRPSCAEKELELLKDLRVTIVKNDLDGNSRLDIPAEEIHAAIHLLGSIQAPAVGTYRSVHENKTRFLAAECRRLGIKRLVYLGTLGASPNGASEYLRTKWLAEEEIRASGLEYVILRAPLIFGKSFGMRESKVLARLKEVIRIRKFIPLVGSGENLLQPIYIGDLVHCLEKAATDATLRDEHIDLGGPQKLSFEQIVDALAANLHIRKPKLSVPRGIMLAVAFMLERWSTEPPITRDQVRMMALSITADTDRMRQVFGPPVVPFKDGL